MTKKFLKMAEMYQYFGREFADTLDWSDAAKEEMFNVESFGGQCKPSNGFFQGKRIQDITVSEWCKDLTAHDRGEPRLLFSWELYLEYPKWFIDKVLPKGRFRITEEDIESARLVMSK